MPGAGAVTIAAVLIAVFYTYYISVVYQKQRKYFFLFC